MNTPRKPAGHEALSDDDLEQIILRAYHAGYNHGSAGRERAMPEPRLITMPVENLSEVSPGNYTSMIRREGDGYDTGDGQGDPLVQEPS